MQRRTLVSSGIALGLAILGTAADGRGLDFAQLAALREVDEVAISPQGDLVAYVLHVPRRPAVDEDGPNWAELWVVATAGGEPRPFVHGEVSVDAVRFSPNGREITYLAQRDEDEHDALWAVPVDGGESRRLFGFEEDIRDYAISPDGRRVAFVADEPKSKARAEREEQGYEQRVQDEDWQRRRVFLAELPPRTAPLPDPSLPPPRPAEPRALEVEDAVFAVRWTPDGTRLVLSVAPRPLIDDEYMLRRVRVVDATTGAVRARFDNPGKLGELAVSPDGKRVAMISAADPNDPREGRLLVASLDGGPLRDLLEPLEGHVTAIAWQDPRTVMFLADVGVETLFGEVDVTSGSRTLHLVSAGANAAADLAIPAVLTALDLDDDGRTAALIGSAADHPPEVFVMRHGERAALRLTESNPWLDEVPLARQEVWRHEARDGLELEGILIHPLGSPMGRVPLVLIVHGGPESHFRDGWLTTSSRPGQLLAARGFAVFHPNYRGSTGRGVAFSKLSQGDAAGAEFDDLVDAVDALIADGLVDRDRVGVTGGSYGGYATAWLATRHSERFRAGVMFVGISNTLTKPFTTEIPNEDFMVHTLARPWTRWQQNLETSPLYHAEKSTTALLIAAGTADTRVDPSQSLQLYRALEQIGKAPVRYVKYPGEGHGNRKAAARDDYARRLVRWFEQFLVQKATTLPPWELEEVGSPKPQEDEEDEKE